MLPSCKLGRQNGCTHYEHIFIRSPGSNAHLVLHRFESDWTIAVVSQNRLTHQFQSALLFLAFLAVGLSKGTYQCPESFTKLYGKYCFSYLCAVRSNVNHPIFKLFCQLVYWKITFYSNFTNNAISYIIRFGLLCICLVAIDSIRSG